jgi:hypothetical protein
MKCSPIIVALSPHLLYVLQNGAKIQKIFANVDLQLKKRQLNINAVFCSLPFLSRTQHFVEIPSSRADTGAGC